MNSKKLSVMLGAVAMLAACGGGTTTGAASTTTGAPTAAPSPAPAPAPAGSTVAPVTNVAVPTYAAGTPQLLAFNELNSARSTCGFGKLAQSSQLDQAAAAHAAYQTTSGVQSHTETAGQPGFTGVNPWDRAGAAGFPGVIIGEGIGSFIYPATDTAADAIRGLLAAPYHQKGLLDGYRNVGFGWGNIGSWPTLTVDLGTKTSDQAQAPGGVVTYPCAGITDAIPAQLGGENPNPLPNVAAGTVWGQPIAVYGPGTMRVTSATITGPNGSVAILALYGDGQTIDPYNDYKNGWASIIPAQLSPNTSYAVAINYTVNGVTGVTNFIFSTGH